MELVYIIGGCALGALIIWLVMRAQVASRTAALQSQKEALQNNIDMLEKQLSERKAEYAENITNLKQEYAQSLNDQQAKSDQQRREDREELEKSYMVQLNLFREQITTSTEQMLKQRSGELQDANTKRMDEIFAPLKQDLQRMEQSMTEHRVQNAKTTAGFEQTIKQMLESNEQMRREADRLSTALQKQNKTVGNWGELILSELLESQGLKPGTHFDVQQTLKDNEGATIKNKDTGSRMIPDVVLHLADNRDVVVDSKMSLSAFIDYQNAETEELRQEALKRHLTSVRNHIKELSGKDYSDYIKKPRKSIDFVIMFVPIEGALQLALSADAKLWREAFDKKVFITGAQSLIAALRIIDLTWVNVLQDRNTQKIMDEARKLINRVDGFYQEFKKVGDELKKATNAYDTVCKRVNYSNQSILATGRKLEELGARGKKPLPPDEYDLPESE